MNIAEEEDTAVLSVERPNMKQENVDLGRVLNQCPDQELELLNRKLTGLLVQ